MRPRPRRKSKTWIAGEYMKREARLKAQRLADRRRSYEEDMPYERFCDNLAWYGYFQDCEQGYPDLFWDIAIP